MPTIYYKGDTNNVWEDNSVWCFNANGTNVLPALEWPWKLNQVEDDGVIITLPSSYANYDLALANGVEQPAFLQRTTDIAGDITGSCAVNFLTYSGGGGNIANIYSGKYPCVIWLLGTTIFGGEFTGSYILEPDYFPIIYGGSFSGDWVSVGSDGNGNTTLSMFGVSLPPITFKYPTPPSGGGGLDVGRLIGLPPFIRL